MKSTAKKSSVRKSSKVNGNHSAPQNETPAPRIDTTAIPTEAVEAQVLSTGTTIKSLAQKAILIQLKIGVFMGGKKDKNLSTETAKDCAAEQKSIRVWKSLMSGDKNNTAKNDVVNAAQNVRMTFYKLTAPWSNEGQRVCRIDKYVDTKVELEKRIREFNEAKEKAIAAYDDLIKTDMINLGSAFNIADYPTKQEFASKFYAELNVAPIPASDFRSGHLDDTALAEINSSIDKAVANAVKGSEMHLAERILEKLSHLLERVTVSGDQPFRASAISNTEEVLKEVEALNINDSDAIVSLVKTVGEKLKGLDAEEIRASSISREDAKGRVKAAVDEVTRAMESFYS